MAVTGGTAKYKLPYFKSANSPPDMAAVTKAISERIEALLAKGGDVSIAADGTITIGAKKVTAAMLVDGAVTDTKLGLIRGRVSSAGAVVSGSGFTAEKSSTGVYVIKFTVEYPTTPIVLPAAEIGALPRSAYNSEIGSPKKEARIRTFNEKDEVADVAFGFVAMLPV